jgi:iron complex outermembrane receptor protein
VTVFTREDLERLGLTSVIDALRLAAGVDARARGPRDAQTDFSIRGATFGQSLVLVDGLRLNDSQSGHHNGDIPMALAGTDRIEVVNGPTSAVHGADGLGGAINVITREDAHAIASVTAGQFGYVSTQASASGFGLPDTWTLTGWAGRSGGYATARTADVGDFAQGGAALRGRPMRGLTFDVRHQRKAFGANGFYGASPSKEWTDQTIGAATFRGIAGDWITEVRGLYRNHGDHFRWDVFRPGFAENRHRTHATDVTLTAQHDLSGGRRVTLGSGGGNDWIRSSNLGDRQYTRVHAFGEIQAPLADRTLVQAGLRFDSYSRFGRAWSPSAAVSSWLTDRLRVRASTGFAFRIPTFTELYYRDPAHMASAELAPEQGWTLDGGVDWMHDGWVLSVSPFIRWDEDVIDWIRERPEDLWQTTNVRDVTTRGAEMSVSRHWGSALLRASYTVLDVDAPALTLLSKYVLEYARHSAGVSVAAPLGGGYRFAVNVDHRARYGGETYQLVSARFSRVFGRADLFFDASNLLDQDYVEIPGVIMPGRWISAGITIR